MKRKLRIFSNIAIICLSVCMFAFGVYAANTVSVTTSGTVTFNASGVYAQVSRTITGAKTNPTITPVEFGSDSSENAPVPMDANLEFETGDSLIEIKFTIQNKATEEGRNIYATVKDGTKVASPVSNNVKQVAEYLNTEIIISPNTSRTISIYLYVEDVNMSANATYDYEIFLKSTSAGTLLTSENVEISDNGDGTCTITEITSEASHITIPDKIGELTVVGLGTADYEDSVLGFRTLNTTLQHITMSNNITTIKDYAFYYCGALEYVGFSSNINEIGDYAFTENKIKSVVLPNIETISYGSFTSTCLDVVVIPNTVKTMSDAIIYSSSYSCSVETLIFNGSLSEWELIEMEENAGYYLLNSNDSSIFVNGDRLVNLTLSAETIEGGKYSYCASIKNLTINNTVKTIGEYAFNECRNLTSVTIPTSVTKIEGCAFYTGGVYDMVFYYSGTKEQFKTIDIDYSGMAIGSMVVIHCTDGDLTYDELHNS